MQLSYPSGITDGISCASQIVAYDDNGLINSSDISYKYITSDLETLTLRTELLMSLSLSDSYTTIVNGWCLQQNTTIPVPLGSTTLIVDRYSAAD